MDHDHPLPRPHIIPPTSALRNRRRSIAGLAALALLGGLSGAEVPPVDAARPAGLLANGCTVALDKTVAPSPLVIDTEGQVALSVQADCERSQAPLRMVFVLDNSVDMGGPRMEGLKNAVTIVPEALDLSRSQIGVVVFHNFAEILTELTSDAATIVDASKRFFPRQGHNVTMGLRAGHQMLLRARAAAPAPGVTEVVVLMAAGANDNGPDELLAEAAKVKADGILVVTIGAGGGADYDTLEAMASAPTFFFTETIGARFPSLFREVIAALSTVKLIGAQVTDTLSSSLTYVWGTGIPAPRVRGADLAWRYAIWPPEGIRITYRALCTVLGRYPAGVRAEAVLEFDRGAPETFVFPLPEIDCVPPPTETPTPSLTPTITSTPTTSPTATATIPPTPTPMLRPAYLPVTWNGHCLPAFRRADVVLLLDTSSSMLEPAAGGEAKLQLALDAASAFVDALALPADQAAVVTFNNRADVLKGLSGNRVGLQIALSYLFGAVRYGSRIDLGIATAADILAGPDRDPANTPVIILLTDGLGEPERARAAAAAARSGGLTIYAVGLGATVDGELMADLAGNPEHYFASPDGANLQRIYLDIARATGCGLAP